MNLVQLMNHSLQLRTDTNQGVFVHFSYVFSVSFPGPALPLHLRSRRSAAPSLLLLVPGSVVAGVGVLTSRSTSGKAPQPQRCGRGSDGSQTRLSGIRGSLAVAGSRHMNLQKSSSMRSMDILVVHGLSSSLICQPHDGFELEMPTASKGHVL